MLPRATVIDVRRHPMDSCLSTYKQYFAQGQSFSYDLGRYYRCYLSLRDHWDKVLPVLPGKVLHLQSGSMRVYHHTTIPSRYESMRCFRGNRIGAALESIFKKSESNEPNSV